MLLPQLQCSRRCALALSRTRFCFKFVRPCNLLPCIYSVLSKKKEVDSPANGPKGRGKDRLRRRECGELGHGRADCSSHEHSVPAVQAATVVHPTSQSDVVHAHRRTARHAAPSPITFNGITYQTPLRHRTHRHLKHVDPCPVKSQSLRSCRRATPDHCREATRARFVPGEFRTVGKMNIDKRWSLLALAATAAAICPSPAVTSSFAPVSEIACSCRQRTTRADSFCSVSPGVRPASRKRTRRSIATDAVHSKDDLPVIAVDYGFGRDETGALVPCLGWTLVLEQHVQPC